MHTQFHRHLLVLQNPKGMITNQKAIKNGFLGSGLL